MRNERAAKPPTAGGFCCGLLMIPVALALLGLALMLFYLVLH
jgi:hypothetical protein